MGIADQLSCQLGLPPNPFVGIADQLSCQLGLPPNPFVGIADQLSCQLGLPPNPFVGCLLINFPASWVYPPTPLKGGYVVDYIEYRIMNIIYIFKNLSICEPEDFYA